MATLYLSIGSNIEPEHNIQQCAKALSAHFNHIIWSPVYRSAAIGMVGDDFLNAVVLAQTDLSINQTTQLLKQLEHQQGRKRTQNKFTSRTLDIDLLLYNDQVINSPNLTLPSPELNQFAHVLVPLVDIDPDGKHPVLEKSYQQLLHDIELEKPQFRANLHRVNVPWRV